MKVEGSVLGTPSVKANELLTFDYFLDSQKILRKYLTRFTAPMFEEQAEKRRKLLKESDGKANDFDSAFETAIRESTHLHETCEKVA